MDLDAGMQGRVCVCYIMFKWWIIWYGLVTPKLVSQITSHGAKYSIMLQSKLRCTQGFPPIRNSASCCWLLVPLKTFRPPIELHALRSGCGFRKSATILTNHHCRLWSGPPGTAYITGGGRLPTCPNGFLATIIALTLFILVSSDWLGPANFLLLFVNNFIVKHFSRIIFVFYPFYT